MSQAQVEKYIPGIVRDSGKSEDEVQAMLRLLDAETYSDLTRDALAKFETMLKNP